MNRELTPWERLDGIKHSLNFHSLALDSIIEAAVEWERLRIIELLEENHLTAASELIEQDALIKGEK